MEMRDNAKIGQDTANQTHILRFPVPNCDRFMPKKGVMKERVIKTKASRVNLATPFCLGYGFPRLLDVCIGQDDLHSSVALLKKSLCAKQ